MGEGKYEEQWGLCHEQPPAFPTPDGGISIDGIPDRILFGLARLENRIARLEALEVWLAGQYGVWITRDLRVLKISEMDLDHLGNLRSHLYTRALHYNHKEAMRRRRQIAAMKVSGAAEERAFEELEERKPSFYFPIYDRVVEEIEKRNRDAERPTWHLGYKKAPSAKPKKRKTTKKKAKRR